MKRGCREFYCKRCGKAIGYYEPTGRYLAGYPEVKPIFTHSEYKDVVVFPNAKEDKYKYGRKLICGFCNKEAE